MNEAPQSVWTNGEELCLKFSGKLDAVRVGAIWRETLDQVRRAAPARLVLELEGLESCDSAGLGLLHELRQLQRERGREALLRGEAEEIRRRLARHEPSALEETAGKASPMVRALEELGRMGADLVADVRETIDFTGELAMSLVRAARRPDRVRWRDAFRIAETAGVNALPIIGVIGFLMGLIMAFQSAIPMSQFGVEIFVADLIAITMLKEMGPLVTAIILAGRSGSAFAAELGTMKVNEEIDALTTTGLDPVPFLAVTRVLACVVMSPPLALFASLFGLIGGAVVVMTMGYPLTTYLDHVRGAVGLEEIFGGLLKSVVFGLIVGGIGCLRGLQTGTGATAVGASTTRAVVSGIILITIADGVFAVIFYRLGI